MPIVVTQQPNGEFVFNGRAYNITEAKNKALSEFDKQVHDYGLELQIIPELNNKTSAVRQQIGNARFVRNRYLNDRIEAYSKTKTTLSVNQYKKKNLPALKQEFPFLQKSDKFALEAALEHVDTAYKHFFKGEAKFPKFTSRYKPNGNRYTTKYTNGNIKLVMGKDGLPYIQLPKVGPVRFILPAGKKFSDLIPQGTHILSASVQERTAGQFYVSLQLETVIDQIVPVQEVSYSDVVSMDMGIKSFCVFGNEENFEAVENPRWIKIHAKRLRRFQKALSRKQYDPVTHKGSNNYYKAKLRVSREQRKTANQRKDFHHKLSRKITDNCYIFICEDLNIKGMMKNHHMAKAIASVGWGQFLTFVKYKLEARGGRFIKVGTFFPSSQLCSKCGFKNTAVKNTKVREWVCPGCGTRHDRDGNAVSNIFKEGSRILIMDNVSIADPPAKMKPRHATSQTADCAA